MRAYEHNGEAYLLHRDCLEDWLASPDPDGWTFNLGDGEDDGNRPPRKEGQ